MFEMRLKSLSIWLLKSLLNSYTRLPPNGSFCCADLGSSLGSVLCQDSPALPSVKSPRVCYNQLQLHLFIFLKLFHFTAITEIYSFEVFVGNPTVVGNIAYTDLSENSLLLIQMRLLSEGLLIFGLRPTNPFKLDMGGIAKRKESFSAVAIQFKSQGRSVQLIKVTKGLLIL